MSDEEKILQIIPATGWYATYVGDTEDALLDPVVCFALVETQQNGEILRQVRPMGMDGKLIELVDTATNFKTVIYRPAYTGHDA